MSIESNTNYSRSVSGIIPISLIILGAGSSSRMKEQNGHHKLSLRIPEYDTSLLEATLQCYATVSWNDILLVLGAEIQYLQHHAQRLFAGIQTITLSNPEHGISASIRAAIEASSHSSLGYMLALADMPYIRQSSIEALCSAFMRQRNSTECIVAPAYKSQRGHPIIVGTAFRAQLLQLHGDIGARHILRDYTDSIILLETDDEGTVLDIDTQCDWEYFCHYYTQASRRE
ncbi:MAG: nucleotidyltransferase family protein [Bacteroidota bacterium]|nr:nucleotidyltransferase family protein [Candidatus Kapabacteria bacterium]MDW8220833.1 nucleotidyltransferase family protein [Bacteroidota bacterium]